MSSSSHDRDLSFLWKDLLFPLDLIIDANKVEEISVKGDGNCFWNASIKIAKFLCFKKASQIKELVINKILDFVESKVL